MKNLESLAESEYIKALVNALVEKKLENIFKAGIMAEKKWGNLNTETPIDAKLVSLSGMEETDEAVITLKERIEKSWQKYFYKPNQKNRDKGSLEYFIRFKDNNGGMINKSGMATGKFDLYEAIQWGLDNRNRIVNDYIHQRKQRENNNAFINAIRGCYIEDSDFLQKEKLHGEVVNSITIQRYGSFIERFVIPFIEKEGITSIQGINADIYDDLLLYIQDTPYKTDKSGKEYFYNRGSINCLILGFNKVLKYLWKKEKMAGFEIVRAKREKSKIRKQEILPLDKYRGLFIKKWDNDFLRILCLVGTHTGLRDNEISGTTISGEQEPIQNGLHPSDIEKIEGIYFLNIRRGKTDNAKRKVPISKYVYDEIQAYIKKNKVSAFDFIFNKKGKALNRAYFSQARDKMAEIMGEDKQDLKRRKIGFYELCRHAYRTAIINSGIIPEAQKYYIGHSNNTDADEVYIHYEKLPQKERLADAQKIIDRMTAILF